MQVSNLAKTAVYQKNPYARAGVTFVTPITKLRRKCIQAPCPAVKSNRARPEFPASSPAANIAENRGLVSSRR
jgi:hypothetical protein